MVLVNFLLACPYSIVSFTWQHWPSTSSLSTFDHTNHNELILTLSSAAPKTTTPWLGLLVHEWRCSWQNLLLTASARRPRRSFRQNTANGIVKMSVCKCDIFGYLSLLGIGCTFADNLSLAVSEQDSLFQTARQKSSLSSNWSKRSTT